MPVFHIALRRWQSAAIPPSHFRYQKISADDEADAVLQGTLKQVDAPRRTGDSIIFMEAVLLGGPDDMQRVQHMPCALYRVAFHHRVILRFVMALSKATVTLVTPDQARAELEQPPPDADTLRSFHGVVGRALNTLRKLHTAAGVAATVPPAMQSLMGATFANNIELSGEVLEDAVVAYGYALLHPDPNVRRFTEGVANGIMAHYMMQIGDRLGRAASKPSPTGHPSPEWQEWATTPFSRPHPSDLPNGQAFVRCEQWVQWSCSDEWDRCRLPTHPDTVDHLIGRQKTSAAMIATFPSNRRHVGPCPPAPCPANMMECPCGERFLRRDHEHVPAWQLLVNDGRVQADESQLWHCGAACPQLVGVRVRDHKPDPTVCACTSDVAAGWHFADCRLHTEGKTANRGCD